MSNATPSNKILIVGAGIGGLILAHILHANDVPFEIFERDATSASRKQGWAVALVECLPWMEKMLPPAVMADLYTNSVNHGTGEDDELSFADAATGEAIGRFGAPRGHPGHLLRTSRLGLRNYLLTAGELRVSMGKQFVRYEQDRAAGSVTVFFQDGTAARGRVLVGADGVRSHVCDQLLGPAGHALVPSVYVPVFGEVRLPRRVYAPARAQGNAVLLTGVAQTRMMLGLLHVDADAEWADYFWVVLTRRERPEELYAWLATATKQQVYDFLLTATAELHPTMTEPIRFGGPAAVAQPNPRLMEFVPPEALPAGRVTVLGDAAHAMAPFKAGGANTAILDACELGDLLVKAVRAGQDPAEVLDAYHATMLPRGRAAVLSSRQAGNVSTEQWQAAFAGHQRTYQAGK